MQCTPTINPVYPKHAKISRSQHPVKIFQHRRHGPPQNTRRDRPPQTKLKKGRTFHRHQSHRTRILSTDLHGRTRSPQLLEHRASSEVLPISCQKASSQTSNFNKETWSLGVQFKHPRQLQESLPYRLPQIPTFLCSLKVKGTANRVVGATRALRP